MCIRDRSYTMEPGTKKTDLKGVVSADKGAVTVTMGGTEKKLNSPTPLQPGMIIKTDKQSSAVLSFEDGSSLRLDENSVLTVKSFEGARAIRRDGAPISTVGRLRVSLDQGRLTGALSSPYMFAAGTEKGKETTAMAQPLLLALAEKGPQVLRLLAEGENGNGGEDTPWYLTANNQQARVEVDMPWGVAGIRGTIWMNEVTGSGQTTTVLFGTVNVTANGVTVSVSNGQGTTITSSNSVPSAPAQMTATEAKLWTALQGWLQQVIQNIDQNMPVNQITFTVFQNPRNDQIQINFSNSMSSAASAAGTSTSNSGGSHSSGGGTSATVTLSTGQILGSYVYTAAGVTASLKDSTNAALSGKTVQIYQDVDGDGTLEVDRDALLGSRVTGTDGSAGLYVVLIPFVQPGTTLFAYSPDYSVSSAAVTVTPQTGNYNDPFDVKALLLDQNGQPLSGKSLSMAVAYYPGETTPPYTGSVTTGSDGTAVLAVSNYSGSLTPDRGYYAIGTFAGDGTNQQNQDVNRFYMPDQNFYVDASVSPDSAVYNVESVTATFHCYTYGYSSFSRTMENVPGATVTAVVYSSTDYNNSLQQIDLIADSNGNAQWTIAPGLPIGNYQITIYRTGTGIITQYAYFQITGDTRLSFINNSGDLYAWAGKLEDVPDAVELERYVSGAWTPVTGATVSAAVYNDYPDYYPTTPVYSLALPTTDGSGRTNFTFNTGDGWFQGLSPGTHYIRYYFDGSVSGLVYSPASSVRYLRVGNASVEQTDSSHVYSAVAGTGNATLHFALKIKTASGEAAAPDGVTVNYSYDSPTPSQSTPASTSTHSGGKFNTTGSQSTSASTSTYSGGKFDISMPSVPGLYRININAAQLNHAAIGTWSGSNYSSYGEYWVEWGATYMNMSVYTGYSLIPGTHLKAKLYGYSSSIPNSVNNFNFVYYPYSTYLTNVNFAGVPDANVTFQVDKDGQWTTLGTAVTDAGGDANLVLTPDMLGGLGLDPTQTYPVQAVFQGNSQYSASGDDDYQHRFTNTILKVFAPNGQLVFHHPS